MKLVFFDDRLIHVRLGVIEVQTDQGELAHPRLDSKCRQAKTEILVFTAVAKSFVKTVYSQRIFSPD